ncbi:MAG: hypothetical protein AMXMBFR13_48680 [Phycisphaerae bacterium]
MAVKQKRVHEIGALGEGGVSRSAQCPVDYPAVSRRQDHANCIACRPGGEGGLALKFDLQPDGSVAGVFACDSFYQGYEGCLHGGVIALLLDAAMMNCLATRGISGVTIRLNIQYRQPVEVDAAAAIRAWMVQESSVLQLRAELRQQGRLCAAAEGVFISQKEGWPP